MVTDEGRFPLVLTGKIEDQEEIERRINRDVPKYPAADDNEVKTSVLKERACQDFLYDYHAYVGRYGPHESPDINGLPDAVRKGAVTNEFFESEDACP